MKDMFDAIVPVLPDQAYFEMRDFGDDARAKLSAAEEPYGCILRGPAAWDPSKQPSFPLYGLCKTNTQDNPDFVPFKYGTVVLSSAETGELILRLMREDSGKTPLATPRPPRPPRPGIPRAKTYSVNDLWKSLIPEDFRGGFGPYQAFLHAGDFQSDPLRFQVSPRDGQMASPFEAVLKSKSGTGTTASAIPSARFDAVPGMNIPTSTGITWTAGRPENKDGKVSLKVTGAFRFQGRWGKDWERLPIHALVAVRGERELDVTPLWIPRAKCRIEEGANKEGAYMGHFSFDLIDLFIAGDGLAKPPKEAWISFVHRDWRGPITKVGIVDSH